MTNHFSHPAPILLPIQVLPSLFLRLLIHPLFMATLSGVIILENATSVDGFPNTFNFDGQMWLGDGRVLTGSFRHYNASNHSFPDVGQFFAWIYVRKPHSHLCSLSSLTGWKIRSRLA